MEFCNLCRSNTLSPSPGGQAFKVRKGTYKKEFKAIYGDCPKVLEVYDGERLRFRDAALHVFVYDQICQD